MSHRFGLRVSRRVNRRQSPKVTAVHDVDSIVRKSSVPGSLSPGDGKVQRREVVETCLVAADGYSK